MDKGTVLKYNERALLTLFLSTYLLSTFLMITTIIWLLYDGKIQSLKENERLKMQEFTGRLAGELIDAAMMGRPPELKPFREYKYTLFDEDKKPLMGHLNRGIQWDETYYMSGNESVYVSRAAKGHLGVEYIVAEDLSFNTQKKEVLFESILIYLVSLIGMIVMAWVLSKIFLRPIQHKVEMLNRFVKDSTHELNTPIASLLLTVDTLEKDPHNQTAMNRLRLLSKKISNLYSDLTFAQLQNMDNMEQENVDIGHILDEAMVYFEPLAKQKNITIRKMCKKTFFVYMTSEAAMRMISNLISNAIKYTPKGGELNILLEQRKLKICDSGIGIDKNKIKKIFERYHRLDNIQGGFGIGLDIVMRVCRRYGIELEVMSQKGEGSCFLLRFPHIE